MLLNVVINILIVVLVIWYWSNTEVSQKDGLFYAYFLSSQIGLFIAYEKISNLRKKLDALSENHNT